MSHSIILSVLCLKKKIFTTQWGDLAFYMFPLIEICIFPLNCGKDDIFTIVQDLFTVMCEIKGKSFFAFSQLTFWISHDSVIYPLCICIFNSQLNLDFPELIKLDLSSVCSNCLSVLCLEKKIMSMQSKIILKGEW